MMNNKPTKKEKEEIERLRQELQDTQSESRGQIKKLRTIIETQKNEKIQLKAQFEEA